MKKEISSSKKINSDSITGDVEEILDDVEELLDDVEALPNDITNLVDSVPESLISKLVDSLGDLSGVSNGNFIFDSSYVGELMNSANFSLSTFKKLIEPGNYGGTNTTSISQLESLINEIENAVKAMRAFSQQYVGDNLDILYDAIDKMFSELLDILNVLGEIVIIDEISIPLDLSLIESQFAKLTGSLENSSDSALDVWNIFAPISINLCDFLTGVLNALGSTFPLSASGGGYAGGSVGIEGGGNASTTVVNGGSFLFSLTLASAVSLVKCLINTTDQIIQRQQ